MHDFEIDNLSIALLSVLAALLVYLRFFSRPEPLVHPLLLGKQSEVSKVRREGESGVYRSWATGQDTPLSVRPASTLKTVKDVVLGPRVRSTATQRCIMDTPLTDEALAEILALIPKGLAALFGLSTSADSPTPILALLPHSPSTSFPLLLLQLAATTPSPLVVLPTPQLLSEALTSSLHPQVQLVVIHASLAEDVIEQVWEDREGEVGVLITGDPGKERDHVVQDARRKGMNVRYWEEWWDIAEKSKKTFPEPQPSDVHSYFYFKPTGAETQVVKVTHQNITSGIAGVLSSFPADKRPSAAMRDTVGSAVSIDTPLGMCIALATVWTGAGLRVIGNPDASWDTDTEDTREELEYIMSSRNQPAPTVLFLRPAHHQLLLQELDAGFRELPLTTLVSRHKLNDITSGHISRTGWTDSLGGLRRLRNRVLRGIAGDKLRALVLVGDAPPAGTLAMSHILLGLPTSRLHPSPLSAGPIFASHLYDLQIPAIPHLSRPLESQNGTRAHTGPPAVNVEVLLKGDRMETEGSEPIEGRLWARGPSMLQRLGHEQDTAATQGWIDLGESAGVQTNGTFIVNPSTAST